MEPTKAENKPDAIAAIASEKITELDVRPILKSGGEPFGAIMSAIQSTPEDGALRLRATFKPTPLFHVLGKQGWSYWIEHGDGDDWTIWFYHATSGNAPEGVSPISKDEMSLAFLIKDRPELQGRLKADAGTWFVDVRGLAPPEPMELTLAVLAKLPREATLVQINERIPQFLLPILEERGLRYEIVRNDTTQVLLRIARS